MRGASRWCAGRQACGSERWVPVGAAVSAGVEESLRVRRKRWTGVYVWAVAAAPDTLWAMDDASVVAVHMWYLA